LQVNKSKTYSVVNCSKASDLSDDENLGEWSMSLKILPDEVVVIYEQDIAKKIVMDYFPHISKIYISYQVNYYILEFIVSNYKVQLYISYNNNNDTTTCKPYFKVCDPKIIISKQIRNSGFPKGNYSYNIYQIYIFKQNLIGNGVSIIVKYFYNLFYKGRQIIYYSNINTAFRNYSTKTYNKKINVENIEKTILINKNIPILNSRFSENLQLNLQNKSVKIQGNLPTL